MDGNGRWAKKRGMPRAMGHRAGTEATHKIVQACGEIGVSYLTIYVFSAENWGRPEKEVHFLMDLLVEMIHKEIQELKKNNVRLHAIGNLTKLPPKTYAELVKGIESTRANTGLNLILALSYGGRDEIVHGVKTFARRALTDPTLIDSLTEEEFRTYLFSAPYPDPELIIRTGGDQRISNFLLWQVAYSELYITETLWPDFDKSSLEQAIRQFNTRERRFGKVKAID